MIIIIAGMHRCGTSALGGLLHHNGILMGRDGDFYPPPMRENPKGFYENVRFRRANDKILAENKYRVKSWNVHPPLHPTATIERVEQVEALIGDYQGKHEHWGWKDPRTSLTIKWWLRSLRRLNLKYLVRILQCTRPPKDVARSMRKRGNVEPEKGQFERLTEVYQDRLRGGIFEIGYSSELLEVPYKELLQHTERMAAKISEFIGLPLADLSHIDPKLERASDGGR